MTSPRSGNRPVPIGKVRKHTAPNLGQLQHYYAPRASRQKPLMPVTEAPIALRTCVRCGFCMGPGFHVRTIAARIDSKTEPAFTVICPYCVEECPQFAVIWIVTEEDYASGPVTRKRFRTLIQQRLGRKEVA